MKIIYIMILVIICVLLVFIGVKYISTDCDEAINQGYELSVLDRSICSYKLR